MMLQYKVSARSVVVVSAELERLLQCRQHNIYDTCIEVLPEHIVSHATRGGGGLQYGVYDPYIRICSTYYTAGNSYLVFRRVKCNMNHTTYTCYLCNLVYYPVYCVALGLLQLHKEHMIGQAYILSIRL